ncbi:MAG: YHS domain-containing (seleno)protein [Pseudolabrys sp.]
MAVWIAVLWAICGSSAGLAAPGDRIVVDPHSGLAISGFDPVAYFTEAKPKIGRPAMELRLDAVIWRFRNEGNRAAFAEHPEVYLPRFGGYDPVAFARGVSVPGHPLFWSVTGTRLYLFYDAAARAAFLADPGRVIELATRKWPEVARCVGR